MKGKLLFAAALVAAGVAGTQAVRLTNGSWNVQLLGNYQQVGTNLLAADDVDPATDETETTAPTQLPTPLAFYDFEGEETGVEYKQFGTGVLPYSVPLSETDKGLGFTASNNQNMGYVQVPNPFYNSNGIEAATLSLWIYLDDATTNHALWGFGLGATQYEDFNNSGSCGFQADAYFPYNMGNGQWIDFGMRNNAQNPIQHNQMTMLTMSFTATGVSLYVDGQRVENYGPTNSAAGADASAELYSSLLNNLKTHFTYFYIGKGGFQGTFSGYADKLGFYDKALTAEEVQALYDSQKDAYANPVDLDVREDVTTTYITNPDFSNENVAEGWEVGMSYNSESSASADLIVHDNGGDQWTGDFYQVINGVPNGIYTLSAQIATRADWAIDLYANDNVTGVGRKNSDAGDAATVYNTWADNPEANRYSVGNIVVTDGTLRIGVRKTNQRAGWLCFDNFRLEKASLSDMMTAYNTMKTNAGNLDETQLQSDLKSRLDAALAAEPAEFTVDAYTTAYFALQAAYDLCNYYLANCTDLTAYIATCKADIEGSTGDATALNNAISAVEGIEWTTVTAEGLQQAYEQLVEAHHAYQAVAVPDDDYAFDMSYLINDAACQDGTTRYWSRNGNAGGYVETIEAFNSDVYSGNGISYWNGSPQSDIKMVWQDTEAVRPGRYRLTAYAAGGTWANGNVNTGNNGRLFLFLNDEREAVPSKTFAEYSVEAEVTSAGTGLSLGLYAGESNTVTWAMISQVKLEYIGILSYEMDEADETFDFTETYADVTMTRTLGAGKWNTFCVPFDMTAEQLAANGITEVVSLSVDDASTAESINLVPAEVTEVKAGMPYLVKVGSDVATISVDGVYVTATAPAAQTLGTVGDYTVTMTGNYSATTVPTGAYFISDNTFYVADAEAMVPLKGFRAYITLTDDSGEPAAVNVRSISIDGGTAGDGTTGIDGVTGEESDKMVDVYTLSGVKVKGGVQKSEALDGLQRGVYIVNGKKIIK